MTNTNTNEIEYLPLHIQIFQKIEEESKEVYFLKKKSEYYKIEPGYDNHMNLGEELLSRVCKLNNIISYFNKNKKALTNFIFNVSYIDYNYKKLYYEQIFKEGNKEQILYCLLYVFIYEKYDEHNNKESQLFMKLLNDFLSWIKIQPNKKEIVEQYWQKVLKKMHYFFPDYLKFQIRNSLISMIEDLNEEEIKNLFPIVYVNGNKEEILSYLEEDFRNCSFNFYNMPNYITFLTQRMDGVEILSTFLKSKADECQSKYSESNLILIRDLLFEYFPNDLHHFDMVDLLNKYKGEVFYISDDKTLIIKYDIDKFQKKYQLKGTLKVAYPHIMAALSRALVKQTTLKINDVNIIIKENDMNKMIIHMDKDVKLVEKDFIQLLKDYYDIFVNDNVESIADHSEYSVKEIPEKLIKNGLVEWLSSYLLAYQLNQNLEEKELKENEKKI